MLSQFGQFPELVFAAGAGLFALVVLRDRPQALAAVWLSVIAFVPWWTGLTYRTTFFPAATLISVFALAALLPVVLERWTLIDWTVTCFIGAAVLPVLVGGSTRAATFGLAFVWIPAYLVGRLLPAKVDARWFYGCIAVVFSAVSVLALAEFALSWNPFVQIRTLAGPSAGIWGALQERGGQLRAEGAFGHSIALGSALALAIPMTLSSRFRLSLRITGVALMLGATAVTFSRTGMLCAALGLGLSLVFMREGLGLRARVAATSAVVVLSVVVVPFVSGTFAAAGTEAANSAGYREQLLSLVPEMNLVGLSDAAQRLSDGTVWFGRFHSIDSELILLGLTYGSIALLGAVLLLLGAVGYVLLGKATAPTIAIAAQIPSLATVALITQYSVFFWFVVGLAVATQANRPAPAPRPVRSPGGRVKNVKLPAQKQLASPRVGDRRSPVAAAPGPQVR